MRLRTFALGALVFLACAGTALAEDDKKDDEFETSWFGGRIGVWYQPALSLHGKVGGLQDPTGLVTLQNSEFDAHDDLGVHTNTPKPTYLDFHGGPVILSAFVDTRWLSIDAFWITPFNYSGDAVITKSFAFAGAQFQLSRPIHTDLAQSIAGFDVKFNILNNRFVRLSPVVAMRTIAIDWTVQDATPGSPYKASTEDINFPLTFGRYKLFPYPEIGAEARAGYRDFIEADIKITGLAVNYLGVEAWTALFDVGVTGYVPYVPYVGLRLGYRYYYFHAKTTDQSGNKQYAADMRISGLTIDLIARF